MAVVQLDKNSDAKKLWKNCRAQGLVSCYRLPHHLAAKEDDDILNYAKAKGRVLFTYDRTIAHQFWRAIVGGCPGVVIIAEDDHADFVRPLTHPLAVKILASFKADFPQWHSVCWNNSIVEVKPTFIEVNHVELSGLIRTPGGFLTRTHVGWQATLQGLLQLNASR